MKVLSGDTTYINLTAVNKTPQRSSVDYFVQCTYTVIEVFSVLLLAIGYACNPISVAVLSRKTFRNTTMSVYLRFVAICDSVTLTTGLVSMFRLSLIGRDIFKNLNICRVYYWTLSVSTQCSSWALLAVTVERVISIVRPHKVKTVCSVGSSKVVVLLTVLIWSSILLFVPFIVGHQTATDPITNLTQTRICVLAHGTPETLFLKYFLDIAAYAIFPSTVFVVCNIIITVSVIQSRKRVLKISHTNKNHKKDKSIGPMYRNNTEIKRTQSKNKIKIRSNKETSLTITLVCINTCYIVCNLPVVAYQLFLQTQAKVTFHDNTVFILLFLVMYFNNVLNFLLYFLTGSRFRQELMQMFGEIMSCIK